MSRLAIALMSLAFAGAASAGQWEVEVTNVTLGQTLTPVLGVVHYGHLGLFTLGQPASDGLAHLAEAGDTGPLSTLFQSQRGVTEVATHDAVGPGKTMKFVIDGRPGERLTLAAMLVPTNDTFFAAQGVFLPLHGETVVPALAYDAGTEFNDQNCATSIPGPPPCHGQAYSPMPTDKDEGYVYVSQGFHNLGTSDPDVLGAVPYDWNDPVAMIKIRRVH